MSYHPDEIRVQELAGVRHIAERNQGIHTDIPPLAQQFLEAQPFLIVGAAQEDGRMWASALFGQPGFLQSLDSHSLRIQALPAPQDPFYSSMSVGNKVGTLAIDFATRRRMRTNGFIREIHENNFIFQTLEVYSNCPKYIQTRDWSIADKSKDERHYTRLTALNEETKGLIVAADTFFITSHHPQYGADASHRGGMPGFVRLLDDRTISFPDYKGNSMFNTLGNLSGYPQAGLLFLDFNSGRMLQLSGTVELEWELDNTSGSPKIERTIYFHIEQGMLTSHGMPLSWSFGSYSPANPQNG